MKNADNQKLKKLKIKIGCVIIAAILVMLVLPVFVNILFLIPAPTKIMIAQYSGEGILIYFSAALSCVGTLSLGLMTVYLNYKQDIFNEMIYENNVKPVLGVGFERKTRENPFDLTLRVSNLSSIIAVNIYLMKYEIYNIGTNEIISKKDFNKLILAYVEPMKTSLYKLENIDSFGGGIRIVLYFKYYNLMNNEYRYQHILSIDKAGEIL